MSRTQLTKTTEDGIALLHVPTEHLIEHLTITGAPYIVLYNSWIGLLLFSNVEPHVFPTLFLRKSGYNDLYIITGPHIKLTISWTQTPLPDNKRTSAMQDVCNVFRSKL